MSVGVLQQASQDDLRELSTDPRLYMRNCWRHPSRPQDRYDFRTADGSETLDFLLDDDSPLDPYNWGSINILLWARGCLKTTTLLGITSWAIQFYGPRGFEGYMTAPREGQVKEFVDKFDEIVEQTQLDAFREKGAIGHQKFRFENDNTPVYGHFKTDTGWGEGDALRGPHSNLGIVDEFQDLEKRSFDTFRECIDQEIPSVPFFPAIFLIGTPKMENSFFHEMWERSDQQMWDDEADEWIAQSEPTIYGDGENEMDVRGWHIDQPASPLHSESKVEEAADTKDEMSFRNEILAQFYSPEDELLADRHVEAICDPEMGFANQRQYDDSYVTIGVDWGGGQDRKAADTVMFVGEHFKDEEGPVTEIRKVKFLDTDLTKDEEFKEIEQAIISFEADKVVVDEGYASKRREDLQEGNHTMDPDGYGNLVVGSRFGNVSSAEKVKWKDASSKRLFTCDKTHTIKSVIDDIKSQNIVLPSADISTGSHGNEYDTGTKIFRQLTAPYERKTETVTGRKRTTITSDSGRNDDAIDALSYMWVGYHSDKIGPRRSFVKFGAHSRPGYR